jgi:YidC/Oxa1 family membrane protein insertase
MDNQRVFLAVVLSLVVLLAWNWLFPPVPQAPVAPETQTEQAAPPADQTSQNDPAPTQSTQASESQPKFVPTGGRTVTVNTPLYQAEINSMGGLLEKFSLHKYRKSIENDALPVELVSQAALSRAPLGISWQKAGTWEHGEWSFEGQDLDLADAAKNSSLVFTGRIGDLLIRRTLSFTPDSYLINETLTLHNTGTNPLSGPLGLHLATPHFTAESNRYNPMRMGFLTAGGLEEEDDLEDLEEQGLNPLQPVQWGAVESNYFLAGILPLERAMKLKGEYADRLFNLTLEDEVSVPPGQTVVLRTAYFLGPKTDAVLSSAPNDLRKSLNYGFFDIIAQPLIQGLNFLYKYVHNYGLAIIILTILIKILFWPLSQKSYKSMEKMKRLQPIMAQIREKYKDDRQKMNTELMQLYKTYKVNPAGGCLPMLLQIPVFIALYQALLGAIELRHAVFIPRLPMTDIVWLADLSAKDPLYITPLIMGATMFLQQKMTPSPGDPTQAKIMLLMPVVFTFIFLSFPSGLVVYWTANNVLSIAQQWLMIRKVKSS